MSALVPFEMAPVSDVLIACAHSNPRVFCNLRFGQRSAAGCPLVHEPVRRFLRTVVPGSRVLIHFQGYRGLFFGTAVVQIETVFWTTDDYPFLKFDPPEVLVAAKDYPNFWGAFILAITPVLRYASICSFRDKTGLVFSRMANQMSVPVSPLQPTSVRATHDTASFDSRSP